MVETKMERSGFVVNIQAGERYVSVPCGRAIVGTKGIFVRNLEMAVGTPVVVQVCRQREELTLVGIVRANYPDLGLAIEFTKKTGRVEQKLATFLAA